MSSEAETSHALVFATLSDKDRVRDVSASLDMTREKKGPSLARPNE